MTERNNKWKRALIFGFITLFICGIGDWLICYEPQGGEPLVFGITSTALVEVPAWFFVLSMVFGILSGFGCKEYAPVMVEIVKNSGVDRNSKIYKAFRFGFASAPLMFISFHTVCCVALLFLQAGLKAGIGIAAVEEAYLLPVLVALVPFTIWCFVVDIPVTVAYIYFVIKGTLKTPKITVICSPLGMSLLAKVIGAVLFSVGLGKYAFLASCGESWGHAFMCLAFCRIIERKEAIKKPPFL